jgi:Fe2+ transport system protein FeoA
MERLLTSVPFLEPVRVKDILDSPLRPKLLEMGVVNGQQLRVLFKAPFGDPIAVEVGDYILSLRLDEARLIEVQ